MGMQLYVYVGAFIRLPEIETTENINDTRCSNPQCVNHKGFYQTAKFCPECGNPIEKVKITNKTKRQLSLSDLEEVESSVSWYDELVECGEPDAVIISNQYIDAGQSYSKDSEYEITLLNHERIEDMKDNLKYQLESVNFFSLLKKHFDISPVVEFGVVPYYN